MFGPNYCYWSGPADTRYCFNVDPTFICPNADPIRVEGEGVTITRDRCVAIDAAAKALMMEPVKLARMMQRSHRSFTHSRERVDGKLTNRCACCGAKMDRLGFRVWIERPKTAEELTPEDRVGSRVAERLGFDGQKTVIVRSAYVDTKREAKQWCLDEKHTAEAIAAEQR